MKKIYLFSFTLFILLGFPQVQVRAQSAGALPFDSCAYPSDILPDQIIYYGSSAQQGAYDWPDATNNYSVIDLGFEIITIQDDPPAADLAEDFFGWGCGQYVADCNYDVIYDYACRLSEYANAYLDGTLTGDPPPTITENHDGQSYNVTATFPDTDVYWMVAGQLADPYVISHDDNDGQDCLNTNDCPTDTNSAVSPDLDEDADDEDLGMSRWSISEPYLNLWVKDCPVEYTTSLGKKIAFRMACKQRDTRPLNTTVPPTGWGHNWFSYIHFTVPLGLGSTNATGGSGISGLPSGISIPTNWGYSVDASQWQAVLYSTANDEHYFSHLDTAEAKSGLTLGTGGATVEFSTNLPNPFSTVDVGGFTLTYPDGSVDTYATLGPPTFSFGMATNRGRIYDLGLTPPPAFTLGSTFYYEKLGVYESFQLADPAPGQSLGCLAADAVLVSRTDPYGNTVTLLRLA